jgi:hypothetical protein
VPRRRAHIPDEDFGSAARGRFSARDEVVIGTEKVAGGRGDIRGDKTGPRLRPGSKANPRADRRAIQGSDWRKSYDEYSEELIGQHPQLGGQAAQTVQPTNTTNIRRPRTLSAGYDRATQTLSVVFRDGTAWNYYGVTYQMWTAFKASPSPGRYIRTRLDFKAYGPPNGMIGDTVEPNQAELLAMGEIE